MQQGYERGRAEAEVFAEVVTGLSVVEQLAEFLAENKQIAGDPLAAAAMSLAADIDASGTAASARASSSVAFQKLMVELRAMLPAEKAVGKLDELKQRRVAKLRATAT